MSTVRLTLGLVLVGAGLVFVAQGLNLPFAPRSFMTRDLTWTAIGAVLVLAGAVVALWRRRGSSA